jgi:hypothetical protein
MNPDSKLILDEMHRLFAEQKSSFDVCFTEADRKLDSCFTDSDRVPEKRFTEIDESVTKRLTDIDDALTKHLTDLDLNWERHITDSEVRQSALSEVEQRQEALVSTIVKSTGALESWRQESKGAMDDLELKMSKLTQLMDRSILGNPQALTGLISGSPPIMEQAAERSPAGITVARPSGHHIETTTRVDGIGESSHQSHYPANGMALVSNSVVTTFHGPVYDNHPHVLHPESTNHDNGCLPKLNFPIYEGENTRLWISTAEDYFDMYDVPPVRWVKVSRMHFKGPATRWIESLEQPN